MNRSIVMYDNRQAVNHLDWKLFIWSLHSYSHNDVTIDKTWERQISAQSADPTKPDPAKYSFGGNSGIQDKQEVEQLKERFIPFFVKIQNMSTIVRPFAKP